MLKYVTSEQAQQDLKDISKESIMRFGERRSKKYYNDLQKGCNLISENPHFIGRTVDFNNPNIRLYCPYKAKHYIIYEITPDNNIVILRFYHTAQDLKRIDFSLS